MKWPKLRELKEAVRSAISKPYTTRYPFEPSVPPEGFRGRPKFYVDDCVGCKACAEVCPSRAIDVEDKIINDKGWRKLTHHYDICIYCGQCERACITEKGIRLTAEYELSGTDRSLMIDEVEKELFLCERCRGIIAPVDHIRWIADKLGSLAFTNPTVLLAKHDELKLLEEIAPWGEPTHKRSDYIRILCPNCRREVIFTEQW